MLAALAVVLVEFFGCFINFPVHSDYSVDISLASGVHVEVFCDVELLFGSHHVVEDFKEVEAEIFGVHFIFSFP